MTLTIEQARQLVSEINAIAPGTANLGGYNGADVIAILRNPATGTSGAWYSYHAKSIPGAAEIVADIRAQVGIRAKRAARAIRAERGVS